MPQIIMTGDTSGLAQGISTAGSALAQGLQQRFANQAFEQQNLQKQQELQKNQTVLSKVLSDLPPNPTVEQLQSAYNQIASQTSPEFAANVSKIYEPYLKQALKEQSRQNEWKSLFGGATPQGQGTQPVGEPSQVQPQENPFQRFTDDQLVNIQALGSDMARRGAAAEMQRRSEEKKSLEGERKEHRKISDKAIEKVSNLQDKVNQQEIAIQLAESAISGAGPFSWANLANRTGMQEFQSPEGAALALGAKYNIVGNIRDVSARAQNQWLERQFSAAYPMTGQTEAANKTTLYYTQAQRDMNKSYIENFNRLAAQDRQKHGYVRDDIESRAQEASQQQYKEILKKAAYKVQRIIQNEKGYQWLVDQSRKKVEKGTVATPEMIAVFIDKYKGDVEKALENMQKMGYDLISGEEVEQWQ